MTKLAAVAFCVTLLTGVPSAFAQVSVTLDKRNYGPGSQIAATVTLPAGARVTKPRFHALLDGRPLPNNRSRGWVEFPELVATQELTLRAPEELGKWWLILNDGDRLVARVPFDVVDWMILLALKRDELMANQTGGAGRGAGGSVSEESATPMAASPSNSPRGYLRLATPNDLTLGQRFEVVVTLPYSSPDDGDLVLKWGHTVDLPWAEKETAPESSDFAPTVRLLQLTAGSNTVSLVAPHVKPGRFELRLFRGSQLLDALVVSVKL